MKFRATVVLGVLLTGCGDDDVCGGPAGICVSDAYPAGDYDCDLFAQTGCAAGQKCTWLHVGDGHIGCAPDGRASAGEACGFVSDYIGGYDNCKAGTACVLSGTPNVCKPICSIDGTTAACDATHTCIADQYAFTTMFNAPVLAGVCEPACDPLDDNDFDGSGSASTKVGSACGNDPTIGCYGRPSDGVAPKTGFMCMPDTANALRHRARAPDIAWRNACSQGYLPMLVEDTNVTAVFCVALCKPMNCYLGNCGSNDENRLGEAPHRCNATDRVGSFDTSANGEHCRYFWSAEIDSQKGFLPSPWSNAVGFCYDHSEDTMLGPPPPCATLPDGFGSGNTVGAADVGCVDTTHANLAPGQLPRRMPSADFRLLAR